MLQPGDSFPDEDQSASASNGASTVSSKPTTTWAPSSTSEIADKGQNRGDSNKFPSGAIAGIVVGSSIILALAAIFCFMIDRRRTARSQPSAVNNQTCPAPESSFYHPALIERNSHMSSNGQSPPYMSPIDHPKVMHVFSDPYD